MSFKKNLLFTLLPLDSNMMISIHVVCIIQNMYSQKQLHQTKKVNIVLTKYYIRMNSLLHFMKLYQKFP